MVHIMIPNASAGLHIASHCEMFHPEPALNVARNTYIPWGSRGKERDTYSFALCGALWPRTSLCRLYMSSAALDSSCTNWALDISLRDVTVYCKRSTASISRTVQKNFRLNDNHHRSRSCMPLQSHLVQPDERRCE